MKRKYVKYFEYIVSLLLFGLNGVVATQINLPSYRIVLLRTMTGRIFLFLLFCLSGRTCTFYRYKKDALFIIISGIAMGLSWICLYKAYDLAGVGVSTLLYYCGTVIVILLSPILFKENLIAWKTVGFVAVVCGISLISGLGYDTINVLGVLYGGISAVMYAAMVCFNKKAEHIIGIENALLQLVAGFLTVAVFTGIRDGGYSIGVASSDRMWILILGVVNTGIGCGLYFSSINDLPAQTVAVCGCLEPLSAVVFSSLFLHETMTGIQIVGAVLIVLGVIVAESFDILKNTVKYSRDEK